MAAVAAVLEDLEELMAVVAVDEPGQDLALADSVANAEAGTDFTSKLDIGELVDVDENNEPEEDRAELQGQLAEQYGELANIKCFSFVHGASEHIGPISEEVADSLDNCPRTHVGRDSTLVGKLKVVEPKQVTKQVDDDQINLLLTREVIQTLR